MLVSVFFSLLSFLTTYALLTESYSLFTLLDPIVCPPDLVSGYQWRVKRGFLQDSLGRSSESPDGATDFEGDPDPESSSEAFVYTEKRKSDVLVSLLLNFANFLFLF